MVRRFRLEIHEERRNSLKANHSATHLLNAALKKVLGDHIRQMGSLVHTSYLRFDFSHPKSMSSEEIVRIEDQVNQVIQNSYPVQTLVLPKKEAEKKGAVMTFGEKYGDVVRVVEMGEASIEFCGGTHVQNTNDIIAFLINRESSPGAGNRRIEAVSGTTAFYFIKQTIEKNSNKVNEIEKLISQIHDSEINKTFIKISSDLKKELESSQEEIDSNQNDNQGPSAWVASFWQRLRETNSSLEELEIQVRKKIKKINGRTWFLLQKTSSKKSKRYCLFLNQWEQPSTILL